MLFPLENPVDPVSINLALTLIPTNNPFVPLITSLPHVHPSSSSFTFFTIICSFILKARGTILSSSATVHTVDLPLKSTVQKLTSQVSFS